MPDRAAGQGRDLSEATVAQITIPVTDLERAIPFYRDTLGVRFLFTAPPQMSFFMTDNVRLLVGVPEGHPRENGSVVYFGVTDIQSVHATLAARGVEFQAEPHLIHKTPEYELWLAEFHDPDGNVLALMEEKKNSN